MRKVEGGRWNVLFQYFQIAAWPYVKQGDKPMREPTLLTASTPVGSTSSAILGTTVFVWEPHLTLECL